MKVEIKLYKTYDPELYALSAYGIKVTSLIKKALAAYVRGEYVNFHIPRSLTYDFDMKRKKIHLSMTITDPESIDFLKKNIKTRYRTAFLKSLLRGSFTTPQLGVFFKNESTNKADTKMIKLSDVEYLENFTSLEVVQKPLRDYTIIFKDLKNTNEQNKQNEENSLEKPKKSKKAKKNKKYNNDKQNKENINKTISTTNTPPVNEDLEKKPDNIIPQDKFGIKFYGTDDNSIHTESDDTDDNELMNGFSNLIGTD